MLLCAIIGISIASYIRLGTTAGNISNRAFYNNAAMNLAESGLEQAMYSVNTMAADGLGASSPGWATTGYGWYKLDYTAYDPVTYAPWGGHKFAYHYFNFFQLGQNTSAGVFVMVKDYDALKGVPAVTAWAFIYPKGASGGLYSGYWWPPWSGENGSISKWVRVTLYKRSKFANGLVAKETITFKGTNPTVDSWNSDPDNSSATAAVTYPTDPDGTTSWNEAAHDLGTVGSIAVTVDAIAAQNADIFGYAATGGSMPTIGSQGKIGPFGTANGTMDPSHVSTDFTANFDPVTTPTGTYSLGNITTDLTLPRGGDSPAADGKYYYTAGQINFTNKTLLISGKVVLVLTNTSTSIDIGGGSGILSIATAGQLECYAPGDIKIAGKGVSNGVDANADGVLSASESGQPIQCQIYGTKTSGLQTITITGNGALSAVCYAPQGDVSINGNGDVLGSVVADKITLVGNAAFHYDESLANMVTGNPYGISKWDELTSVSSRSIWW
jgi:hypothetical protein